MIFYIHYMLKVIYLHKFSPSPALFRSAAGFVRPSFLSPLQVSCWSRSFARASQIVNPRGLSDNLCTFFHTKCVPYSPCHFLSWWNVFSSRSVLWGEGLRLPSSSYRPCVKSPRQRNNSRDVRRKKRSPLQRTIRESKGLFKDRRALLRRVCRLFPFFCWPQGTSLKQENDKKLLCVFKIRSLSKSLVCSTTHRSDFRGKLSKRFTILAFIHNKWLSIIYIS